MSTDNPADVITPDKIGSKKLQFVRQQRNKAWSSARLVQDLAGDDPQKAIVSRVSAWWARYFDRATIQHLNGIVNSNIANNASDMVHDITANTGTVNIGGNNYDDYTIHGNAIIDAAQTMGDSKDGLKLIIMHSAVVSNLRKQNLIQYIPNARGEINIPTYMGYRVLETDNVPTQASGADTIFTSYLCGEGVLGFGEYAVDLPVETDSYPAQGNGRGVEALFTRRQFGFHPLTNQRLH